MATLRSVLMRFSLLDLDSVTRGWVESLCHTHTHIHTDTHTHPQIGLNMSLVVSKYIRRNFLN